MLWLKSFHVIFMVTWFAGLFYLPRLFVYHAQAQDKISIERFILMERKLYYGIMIPGAILTIFFGLGLLHYYLPTLPHWLLIKLGFVGGLIIFHAYCGHLRKAFARGQNRHTHVFYRILNEIPVIFLVAIVLLVELKPSAFGEIKSHPLSMENP